MTIEKTLLHIPDMTCGSCERHVLGALRPLPGVKNVTVTLARHEALVEHEGGSVGALLAALEAIDYPASEVC